MNDQLVQEIVQRLDQLGELGGQGYEILLRQVYINAVSQLLWGLALAAILFPILVKCLKNLGYLGGEQVWCKGHYSDRSGAALFTLAGMGGILIMVGVFITGAVMRFINPDYYAIKEILRAVSG